MQTPVHRPSRAILFSGSENSDSGRVYDGQTNSVLFHLSAWPSSVVPSQRTTDGLTDRRILFLLTDLSGCRASLYFPSPIPHPRPRRFDDERRIPRGRRPGPAEAGLALTESRGKYLFAIWIGVHSVRLGLAAVCSRCTMIMGCGDDHDDDELTGTGPCHSLISFCIMHTPP